MFERNPTFLQIVLWPDAGHVQSGYAYGFQQLFKFIKKYIFIYILFV